MRALVQRVADASVSVEGDVRRIGGGLVVFVGVGRGDDEAGRPLRGREGRQPPHLSRTATAASTSPRSTCRRSCWW